MDDGSLQNPTNPLLHDPDEITKMEEKYKMKKPKKIKCFEEEVERKKEALLKKIPPIMFRWDWGALPPKVPETLESFLHIPVPIVHFTYTGREECHTEAECLNLIKETQKRDMNERGLSDIQHNFYIGNDGKIYEGVGWIVKSTKEPEFADLYAKSIDIAYMGDYSNKEPENNAMKLSKLLLNYMYDHRLLADDYELIPLKKSRKIKMQYKETPTTTPAES